MISSTSPPRPEVKARVLLQYRRPAGSGRWVLALVEQRVDDRRKLPQRAAGLVFLTGLEPTPTSLSTSRQVLLHGRALALTPKEFDLLALLASAPGRVFTDAEIVERIWSGKQNASSVDVAQ
jgi:DNA-binding response OmpR family regulator